ncbi:MAG: Hsp70 family protein, partial [Spirochaetota bacterium]
FDIDANGIVHVSAKDLGTGKEQKIRIESSSGLNEDEINRMVKEAEANAEADKQARETAEARNEGDQLAYQMEKALSEHGEKIPESDRTSIQEKISALRGVLESGNAETIRAKMEELNQASHKLAEQLYQTQGAAAGGAGTGAGAQAGPGGFQRPDGGDQAAGGSRAKRADADDVDFEVVDE